MSCVGSDIAIVVPAGVVAETESASVAPASFLLIVLSPGSLTPERHPDEGQARDDRALLDKHQLEVAARYSALSAAVRAAAVASPAWRGATFRRLAGRSGRSGSGSGR